MLQVYLEGAVGQHSGKGTTLYKKGYHNCTTDSKVFFLPRSAKIMALTKESRLILKS